ncbi:hypothetical protein GBF35_20325 [Nonomuraea phyllanthi]|uniref:hypothetical protein n=1 Tax=Nonomuraea phyllanthi TaxID=2219224 RepID=UPI00129364BD|nr:hypothetical protein [Nonomuraea phyllanthi]QFY08709.1 hypothetical protein GBF35_20325 [Nonomuraea phyllanthi]
MNHRLVAVLAAVAVAALCLAFRPAPRGFVPELFPGSGAAAVSDRYIRLAPPAGPGQGSAPGPDLSPCSPPGLTSGGLPG